MDYGFRDKSKSFSKKLMDSIPNNLKHYFWRGFLDGDGCITLKKQGGCIVSLACPIDYDWRELELQLQSMGIKFCVGRIKNKKYKGNSRLNINNLEGCYKFLSYIYTNRNEDGIGLSRKYKKFLSAKDYLESFILNGCIGNKKEIIVRNAKGEIIGIFESAVKASRILGISKTAVYGAVWGGNPCKGFSFERTKKSI